MNDEPLARLEREILSRPGVYKTRNEHSLVGIGVGPQR